MAAYGRLDIHEPAGTAKSYYITNEVTSLGRAADNSIVLADPALSARHFRLFLLDGLVHIVNLDSKNGIVVAGTLVQDSAPRPMREITELALGKTKIIFYPRGDQATLPMRAISENTWPIFAPIHVELDKSLLNVYPASSSSVEIAISNRSDKEISLALDIEGAPKAWAKLSQSTARLGAAETAYVMLQVAPPRRATLKPGDYPATLVFHAQNGADTSTMMSLLVRLHGFGGLSLAVEPAQIIESEPARLFLLNQGNEDLRLALRAWDPSAQLAFDFDQIDPINRSIQLAAGKRATVSCRVAAQNRSLIGKARAIPFALLAQADNDCAYLAAMPASVLVKPRLSARLVAAAGMIFAAIALALFAMLTRIPPPEISAFSISQAQVARGETVELTWQASEARRYVIEIDRVAIAELDADASFYTLSTADYADAIEVALIAVAGEATAIEKRLLEVYQPASIMDFSADRQRMVRHVEANLVITWRAEGAVASDLRFAPQFDILSEASAQDGTTKVILRGLPETDFDLILVVEDEIGRQYEERFSIETADPECAPLRRLPLRAGPDRRFERRGVAQSDVPVLALGSEATREWLLVELANGETGWGRLSEFTCAGFDPRALTLIADLPALPTVTPSTTPTATPKPTATATVIPPPTLGFGAADA